MTSRAVDAIAVDGEVIVEVIHADTDSFSRSVWPAAWRLIMASRGSLLPPGTRALTRDRMESTPGGSLCVWKIGGAA